MRDTRSGTSGRPEVGRSEKQLTRYLRKQPGSSLRGIPAPQKQQGSARQQESLVTAQKKYLAARARGHGGAAQILKQRSPAPSISGSKLALGALDVATGIPSLVKEMRSHRGNLQAEVQPQNVAGLLGGLRGRSARQRSHYGHIYEGPEPKGDVGEYLRTALSLGVFGTASFAGMHALEGGPAPKNSRNGGIPVPPEIIREGAIRNGYVSDVQYLVKTKQITPDRAPQAVAWARRSGLGSVSAGRKSLRQKYKLPPLGKAP
jgi:hypothetical protein